METAIKYSPVSNYSNMLSSTPTRKMKALASASPSVKHKLPDTSEDKSNKSKIKIYLIYIQIIN